MPKPGDGFGDSVLTEYVRMRYTVEVEKSVKPPDDEGLAGALALIMWYFKDAGEAQRGRAKELVDELIALRQGLLR